MNPFFRAGTTRTWAVPLALLMLLCLFSLDAVAAPRHGELVSSLTEMFSRQHAPARIFDAAKRAFWSLATIGLVWNLGVILLRRGDFGEFFLELIRFIVFTGLFYWLLTESTSKDGFVYNIVDSFALMGEKNAVEGLAADGDNIIQLGLRIFYRVQLESQNWDEADILIASGLSIAIIVALTLLAAQLALVIIMAWMLAYAGVFLLGLGGTRWTSPVAIGFYKNVLALGASLMLLALLIKFGQGFLEEQAAMVLAGAGQGLDYAPLADMLVVALLLAVLGYKVPGLIYTTVTGSPLGLFGGTASLAGSAFSAGGSHVYSTLYSTASSSIANYRQGGGSRPSAPPPSPGGGGGDGAASAIDAIRNASRDASMEDVIFAPMDTGSRKAGASEESVFGRSGPASAWTETPKPGASSAAHQNQAQAQTQNQASPATDQAKNNNQSQNGSVSSSQAAAPQSSSTQRAATLVSDTLMQQGRTTASVQADNTVQAQAVRSNQQAAGSIAQDAPRASQSLQQSLAGQSSTQTAMSMRGAASQERAPLGLTHAKPDMLAGNVKLGAAQQPSMPSTGFQPEALGQSRHSSRQSVEHASTVQSPAVGSGSRAMPSSVASGQPKGVQQGMHSLGAGASGDGRQALPPPAPNSLNRSTRAGGSANMTEQVAMITTKVNRSASTRLPSENTPEASRSVRSGQASPVSDDEIAAFRDRHLSEPGDD